MARNVIEGAHTAMNHAAPLQPTDGQQTIQSSRHDTIIVRADTGAAARVRFDTVRSRR